MNTAFTPVCVATTVLIAWSENPRSSNISPKCTNMLTFTTAEQAWPMLINQKVRVLIASRQLYAVLAVLAELPAVLVAGRAWVIGKSPSGPNPMSPGRFLNMLDSGKARAIVKNPSNIALFLQPNRSETAGSLPPMAHASSTGDAIAPRAAPSNTNDMALALWRTNQWFTSVIIGSQVHRAVPMLIRKKVAYSCHNSCIRLNSTMADPSMIIPKNTTRRVPSLWINNPSSGPKSPPSILVTAKAHDSWTVVQPNWFLSTGLHTGSPPHIGADPSARISAPSPTMTQPKYTPLARRTASGRPEARAHRPAAFI